MSEPAVGWRIVPASVTGPNHVRHAVVNQDSWWAERLGGGRYLFAVADGAGSAAYADQGSELAVQAARNAAIEYFSQPVSGLPEWMSHLEGFRDYCLQWFDNAVAIKIGALPAAETAGRRSTELRRLFATTLLAVVADPPYFGCLNVGDGFLVAQRARGAPHLLISPPQEREHSGGTVFLTSELRDEMLTCKTIPDPDIRGIALCTDGLIEGVLNREMTQDGRMYLLAPPEFAEYFAYFSNPAVDASDLARKLEGAEFAGTSGDDKTMLMALMTENAGPQFQAIGEAGYQR